MIMASNYTFGLGESVLVQREMDFSSSRLSLTAGIPAPKPKFLRHVEALK